MRRFQDGTWLTPDDHFTSTKKRGELSGEKSFDAEEENKYEFRLRFKVPLVSKLLEIDKAAFNYYYKQVKKDYVNNIICNKEVKAPNNGKN